MQINAIYIYKRNLKKWKKQMGAREREGHYPSIEPQDMRVCAHQILTYKERESMKLCFPYHVGTNIHHLFILFLLLLTYTRTYLHLLYLILAALFLLLLIN